MWIGKPTSCNLLSHWLFYCTIVVPGVEKSSAECLENFMASIQIRHAGNCLFNTNNSRTIHEFFLVQLKCRMKQNFSKCLNVLQGIVGFKFFFKKMWVKCWLVWFARCRFTLGVYLSKDVWQGFDCRQNKHSGCLVYCENFRRFSGEVLECQMLMNYDLLELYKIPSGMNILLSISDVCGQGLFFDQLHGPLVLVWGSKILVTW